VVVKLLARAADYVKQLNLNVEQINMSRILEIVLVLAYNLALLAGSAYMITVHDWSAWILVVALMFAASWGDREPIKVEIGK
jgi:hypothetical protein